MKNSIVRKLALAAFCSAILFAGDIEIKEAFTLEPLPNAKATGIFMQIKNNGKKDVSLIKAKSANAKTAEIHTHIADKNGVMKMTQIPKLTIKANEVAILQRGGLHIMLIDIIKPLSEGSIDLELEFDNGEVIKLDDIKIIKR